MDDRDPEIDALIAELVDFGILIPNGMMGDDFTYSVDMQLAKTHFPDFHEMLMQDVSDTLLELVQKDLVAVDYDENLEARFTLTEKGKEVMAMENIDDYFRDIYPD